MGINHNSNSSKRKLNESITDKFFLSLNIIKSKFILKLIFSYLDIRKKLKIVSYNKQILHKLDYDIDDYKKLSEREIKFEKNKKGKEYIINTNLLIFEGNYLNKKRNGKGKQYYINGKLKSIGNYLKGQKHGKFKEY